MQDEPGSKFGPPIEFKPGSANNIIFLARASKLEYLEALMAGRLRASHIGNYKKEENRGKPFFDENELVGALFDPKRIVIKISQGDKEVAELIPAEDQKVRIFGESDIPALCFYSLHTGLELTKPFPKGKKSPDTFDPHLQITDHISKFAGHVWVIENVPEFHRRMNQKAIEAGIAIRHGLVEYTSLEAMHGRIPLEKWGMVKDIAYVEEREYRYVFLSKEKLPDPYIFDVGNLSDISRIVTMEKFRTSYKVTIEYENNE